MRDWIARTLVPLLTGLIIAAGAKAGFDLPAGALSDVLVAGITGGWVMLSRLIELRWPLLGRILMSLGISNKAPTYRTPPPTSNASPYHLP
ncbi:hypothetical protein ACQEVF_57575 [Nonomuraea polychroma]|uniref:hypothetical protein n=1 Tax=Nonomuraea polychroma TaxID=46176 RepID=UPI003D91396C